MVNGFYILAGGLLIFFGIGHTVWGEERLFLPPMRQAMEPMAELSLTISWNQMSWVMLACGGAMLASGWWGGLRPLPLFVLLLLGGNWLLSLAMMALGGRDGTGWGLLAATAPQALLFLGVLGLIGWGMRVERR